MNFFFDEEEDKVKEKPQQGNTSPNINNSPKKNTNLIDIGDDSHETSIDYPKS